MGKGVDPQFSHAGALAEAAEWLTAREVDRMPGYLAAHQDEVENPLPIEDLLPHIATATPPVIARIKNLDDAQHWVDGWSLRDERPLKVPLEYVRLIGGPNGKASGNFLEEAIVHAIDEIFERRAQVTVLRERMVVPTIDIEIDRQPGDSRADRVRPQPRGRGDPQGSLVRGRAAVHRGLLFRGKHPGRPPVPPFLQGRRVVRPR